MNSFAFLELAMKRRPNVKSISIQKDPWSFWRGDWIGTYRMGSWKEKNSFDAEKRASWWLPYFPEPDLAPIILSKEYIATLQKTLPWTSSK